MRGLNEKVVETVGFLKKKTHASPQIAIILGTGLGKLGDHIKDKKIIDYRSIPYFPVSTAIGHKSRLVSGRIADKRVIALEGRFHYYEGYSLEQVTYPVRVAKALGCKALIVSNAAGGLNPLFNAGDIMVISDHINLMGVNPLIGPNDEKLGPRFPDMCEPYSEKLIKLTEETALEEGLKLHKGVYIGLTGPNLETKAEYRFLRMIGGDVVGMSTVPEVVVAVHAGLKVLGLSVITDRCLPDALKPANIAEIIRVANEAEPKLTRLVNKVIGKMRI